MGWTCGSCVQVTGGWCWGIINIRRMRQRAKHLMAGNNPQRSSLNYAQDWSIVGTDWEQYNQLLCYTRKRILTTNRLLQLICSMPRVQLKMFARVLASLALSLSISCKSYYFLYRGRPCLRDMESSQGFGSMHLEAL